MNFDKVIDILMFREGSEEDSHSDKPVVTTGSVVWGVILRSAIIMFISLLLINYFKAYDLWWLSLFALWLLAVYPGYKQFKTFSRRMEDFEESTLCGSCKHFDPSGQLCRLYDQHVSTTHIPCEGDSWEPKSFED